MTAVTTRKCRHNTVKIQHQKKCNIIVPQNGTNEDMNNSNDYSRAGQTAEQRRGQPRDQSMNMVPQYKLIWSL